MLWQSSITFKKVEKDGKIKVMCTFADAGGGDCNVFILPLTSNPLFNGTRGRRWHHSESFNPSSWLWYDAAHQAGQEKGSKRWSQWRPLFNYKCHFTQKLLLLHSETFYEKKRYCTCLYFPNFECLSYLLVLHCIYI